MIKILLVDSPEKLAYARQIRRKVFVEEQGVSEELDLEGDSEALHFLVEKEGMYVATGRYRIQGPFLKIERLATLPEARGKGVATDLMAFMQALGAEEYPHHLQILNAQTSALLFYKKLGWVPIGEPFDDAGIEHMLMIHRPKEKGVLKHLICLKDSRCPAEIKQHISLLWNN